jgi:hypothetical protein
MQIMDPYKSINTNQFQSNGMNHFGIQELLEDESIDWGSIEKKIKTDPEQFEELLFKIHYKRNKSLTVEKKARILHFLSIGYLSTDDVRYFNEFLWFYVENNIDRTLMDGCMERFNSNLDKKGAHKLPGKLNHYHVDIKGHDLSQPNDKIIPRLRVGLIGFPPFFGTIIKGLKKEGHQVEQFFLPYHPDKYINWFLKFKLPVKILSLAAGNFYSYRTLNFDYKDERIGQVLREGNFDIGFHKLNFIIKENIFGAFRKGLLNDHWGYLPLLRGKSTIAYSVLLNIPVIPTIHFINKEIDSGPIAGYYPWDYSKAKSVNAVRNILRKKMPERTVSAIKLVGSIGFMPKENKKEDGITFYEIHPWLNEHIASRILTQ